MQSPSTSDLHKLAIACQGGIASLAALLIEKTTAPAVVLLCSGIGGVLVGQAGEIVHAGFQRKGDAAALFKTHISFTGLDF